MSNLVTELCHKFAELKAQKSDLEAQVKEVGAILHTLRTVTLPEAMDDADTTKVSIEGVGTIFLQQQLAVHVAADLRDTVYDWLRANGHGALVKDYVFPRTLNAWAKEQLVEGNALPDNMTAAFIPTAMLRKT